MEPVSGLGTFMLLSVTIFLGYAGSMIFSRTKIPDVVWLMLLGLTISYLKIFDVAAVLPISSALVALALLIILFDSGLNMHFYHTLHGFPRSLLMSALGFIAATVSIGAISVLVFRIDLVSGLFLGALLSGTGSPVLLSIMNHVKLKDNVKALLHLESLFTETVSIILAITFVHMMVHEGVSVPMALREIASAFSVGAVLGFVGGILWLFVLERLKGKQFDYMLTFAMLLALYVIVESLAGSGAIASLVFGLVLGNGRLLSSILRLGNDFSASRSMKKFQGEISFFVRSFLFMYIGLIAAVSQRFLFYGLSVAFVLVLSRLAAVRVGTWRMNVRESERKLMKMLTPPGVAAAALSQLPAVYGLGNAEFFSNTIFVVILATMVYSSTALMLFYRPYRKQEAGV